MQLVIIKDLLSGTSIIDTIGSKVTPANLFVSINAHATWL